MRFRQLVLGMLLAMLASATARADVVRGVVWVNRVAARTTNRDEQRPSSRATVARSQRGITDAVVWVDAVPEKLERRLSRAKRRWFWQKRVDPPLPSMAQHGGFFSPHVLVVGAGSAVEFRNRDRVYHNVFSVSAAKRFDLGKNAPGRADTVTFSRPGVVNLHCDIHPEELGYVVVVPNHATARPDSLGAFVLPELLPGHYKLRVWHPRLGDIERAFDVPKQGDVGLRLVF